MDGFDLEAILAVIHYESSDDWNGVEVLRKTAFQYLPPFALPLSQRVVQLGYIMDAFSGDTPDVDADCAKWRQAVVSLNSLVQRLGKRDVGSLVAAMIEQPLFRAVVLETFLKEAPELPAELLQKIQLPAEILQRQFGRLPVPPARGRSYIAGDYVSTDLAPGVCVLIERLNRCLQLHDDACIEGLMDADTPSLSRIERVGLLEFCRARDQLGSLLSYLNRGWPVPAAELAELSRTLHEIISPGLDRLLSFSEIACLLEKVAREVSGPAISTFRIGSGVSVAAERRAPIQSELSRLLKSTSVPDSPDTPVRRFLSASSGEPSLSVTLDLCLFLDNEIAKGSTQSKALREARGVLWRFATARYSLIVVDADVIGRSFPDLADAVQIDRVVHSDDAPRNTILNVITPGYLLRHDDGTQTILRRASIAVSN